MKVLDLVLKGKWYDMIASGEKREEYREIKPYWIKRIIKCVRWCSKGLVQAECKLGYTYCYDNLVAGKRLCYSQHNGGACCGNLSDLTAISGGYTHVRFRRGYTNTTMLFKCEGICIGKGNQSWGAPKEEVFIIKLGERI